MHMGILIKGAKEIKSIFAAVPFIDVNEFRLYGKATQNGTPTPNAPVEIEIAGASGNIVIKSEDKNIATIQTPNGLAGIPVSSGGNFTDSNGQQWICDEIVKYADGTGERIQRVEKYNITGNENWQLSTSIANSFYCNAISSKVKRPSVASEKPILKCSHFIVVQSNKVVDLCVSVNIYGNLFIRYEDVFTSVNAAKTWLSTNNVVVLYELAAPIHTPLTAEEIAEIEKLSTIYPANNVSASDDCDLTLLIGKRYETKEILSAWANKNNKAVEVFTSEREIVVFEATVKLENSVIVYDEYITQENTELIQSETLYYRGTGSGTVLTLTDKALKKYKSISIARSVYYENQRQWTAKFINDETGETETKTFWPVVYIGGDNTAEPVKINGNTVNFEIGAPKIDGYTFVSFLSSNPVQFAITKIRLNK